MSTTPREPQKVLERFAWLSIATAIATVTLKGVAAWITGSVGILSDALESTVNLVAAIIALWALRLAARPADHNHDFGHGKAEYVSAGVEGTMIFVAAVAIIYGAVLRLISPHPLEQPGVGLLLATIASVGNLATGLLLIRAGKRHRSITLVADGKHLMTDVWTSAGVLVAIGLIIVTRWEILDPIIAIGVALNIVWTGYKLIRQSIVGLLDAALPPEEVELVRATVEKLAATDERIEVTGIRTRESGRQRFVYVTLGVPGHWTVVRSHELADAVEDEVDAALPGASTFVHIEPCSSAPADRPEPDPTAPTP